MSMEAQLFQNIQNSIHQTASLLSVDYGHPKVQQFTSRHGFPRSPEKLMNDKKKDDFVLITDTLQECLRHLMEARKLLLLLDVQQEIYEVRQLPSSTPKDEDEDDEEET